MYRLTIRKQAIKALSKMSGEDAHRIRNELKKLAQNPVRVDIDVKPLRGRPGFRLRAGAWRVILERREQCGEIEILRIGQRGDVYK